MVRDQRKRSQRKSRSQRSHRSQRGGSTGYSFTGPAGSAAGVPFASRVANNDDCSWAARQQGGACGCMVGGGGGSGGYGFALDNSLGKVYPATTMGACPSAPAANPLVGGASDAELRGINSYSAGYAMNSPVNTPSATYMGYTGYGRSCMGGARKSRNLRRKNRKSRRSHKSHKSHKSHRA
jgi:hypothetical protein